MSKAIKVLIVEDREDDAELVLLELRWGGYDPTWLRVETAEDMKAALEQPWDIIISDWSMPRFSAMAAFATLREKGSDLPFIIVSGTIGEETAVTAMKAGVHDFMTKGRLSRLIPAIERELREVEIRRQSRKMHEHLLISERMASVGTLAAGVAHEINNPLAAVIGNVEMATEILAGIAEEAGRRKLSPDQRIAPRDDFSAWLMERLVEAQDCVTMIDEAAERMRLVVRDLRVFSHPADEKNQGSVDIRSVVELALRMASTETRHRAQIVREYEEVAPVYGSETRLGQIFLNLIVNAAQSISEGRTAANEIAVALRMAGSSQVIVEVRDTGSGIPPEVLPHIFDPFFTTKPAGIGTGLGLAICHRLITAIGGEISVESELGVGTKFRVVLPVAQQGLQTEHAVVAPAAPRPRARILLVDDEASLRKTIPAMLKKDFDVETAEMAKKAIELIGGGARFDLILCDLMMPEMTGMDLYDELDRTVPEQARRMTFVTGGAFTEGARIFLECIPNAVIEKPFTSQMLRQFILDQLSVIES